MIDFENKEFLKLHPVGEDAFMKKLAPMLIQGEQVVEAYKSVRDGVVFTNMRIIAINIQGVTGKKVAYSTLPYCKIQAFSVETSGVLDIDSELVVWYSGLGGIRFEFTGRTRIAEISRLIAQFVL